MAHAALGRFPINLQLPWQASVEEDAAFSRILKISLGVFLVMALLVTWIDVPEPTREELETLPPELARVILEKQELPKPEPKPEPKPIEKKEPPKPKEPEKKPKPKPEPKKEIVKKPPPATLEKAREKAATSGLLQFKDDLMDMRDSLQTSKLSNANLTQGEAKAKTVERSVIASKAKVASGGINTAALSRDTGGVALSGKEDTVVDSKMKFGNGNQAVDEDVNRDIGARSEDEIRRIMDQNKGAIFAIYNRALRSNPALQGKVTVSMVIEPSGALSSLKLVASELNDATLERKLLARIRLINFGTKSVLATTLNYSFDFLPY